VNCYEDAVRELTKLEDVPELEGEAWAGVLQAFLHPRGFKARFIQLDTPAIVSRRLPNGKVHAEVMHPTLVTILEKE
jgi:hypothetical protein